MHYAEVFFLLLCAHALCDYPLQGDFIAKYKMRLLPGGSRNPLWIHCLTSHALIHGGAVYLITGSLLLGLFETFFHWYIDFAKCEGLFGFHTDQSLHILCKLMWVFALFIGVT